MSRARGPLVGVLAGAAVSLTLLVGCGGPEQASSATTAAPTSTRALASSAAQTSSGGTSGLPAPADPARSATATSTPASLASALAPATHRPASSASATSRPTPPTPISPGALVTDRDMDRASAAIARTSVADRAGTVIMASSADAVGSDLVAGLHLGGVILMGSDGSIDGTAAGTPAQVAAVTGKLQSQVPGTQRGAPLLIATDQEYGLVTRLVHGFTDFPGNAELSSISDTDTAAAAAEAVTRAAGSELLAVGINVDFAPDADVLPESGPSGVDDRSFGSDPVRTGTLVAAAVRGYQRAGVAATIKHFPGIGRLATDTHKALPSLDVSCAGWNSTEAVPMRAGVDAGAALVMTGHVLMPAVGADDASSALSAAVVTDLLRGGGRAGCTGLKFRGVTVSDSFQMAPVVQNFEPAEAAWRGIAAGQDLVLMPADPEAAVDGIVAAVKARKLPSARLTDAATAVYALRLALARSPHPGLDVVGSDAHQAVADKARAAG